MNNFKTGDPIVDAIEEIQIEGDFRPNSWYKFFNSTSLGNAVKFQAITILSGIVTPLLVNSQAWNLEIVSQFTFAANQDFFESIEQRYSISRRCADRALFWLEGLGLIEKLSPVTAEEAKVIILTKKPQQFFIEGQKKCQWCKCNTAIAHKHHYPVPKSKGGKETVTICPNCHTEFHYLVNTQKFRLTPKLIEITEISEVNQNICFKEEDTCND